MRAVAIDDDIKMHRLLQFMLREIDADLDLVGTAVSVDSGVALIEQEQPDLLLLDIELENGRTSFDILQQIDSGKYLIIFISGHNQYGQLALRFEALDYLDKPIKSQDLFEAIVRAKRRFSQRNAQERLADLEEAMANFQQQKLPTRLTVSTSEGIFFLAIDDILRISTADGLVTFHCADGRKIHKSDRLRRYDEQFEPYPEFMLVHKSNLVNLKRVRSIKPGPVLEIEDGTEVAITAQSARRVRRVMETL
ncbi:LytTR family DNA-binding domain-containing protein [Lewinella sp. W8]|uniref:LytR/AlgR family response regulator transcription factor n=1 Tax=Lewinella sp. W8 TaxID=2528208 RepID=UPI0010676353|nr:LytTR family DNA-binding domain-containing protein [Lewinella sp. W8]MTB49983.1 response regulator [Lewinella sp. W8]